MAVSRMTSGFTLYRQLVTASAKEQLAYRADVVIGVVAFCLFTSVEAFGLWVMFDRFGSVQGWQLAEVGLVYGLATSSCGLAECFSLGFRRFDEQVRRGEFDRLLLRPRTTALQMLGYKVSLRALGRVIQGVAVIGLAVHHSGVIWSLLTAVHLAWIIAGAVALFLGVFVLQATAAFWTVEALEVFNVLSYGGVTAAQYPLTIYAPWFRKFLRTCCRWPWCVIIPFFRC